MTIPVADLEIDEVRVVVMFLNAAFESAPEQERRAWQSALRSAAASEGLAGDVALVWQDGAGRKKLVCEPAQRPFFESLRYDQLFAQVNRKLTIPALPASHLSLAKL